MRKKSKQRPYEHTKIQKEVKAYEAYQCLVCGKVGGKMAGHHLIYYSQGGPANLNNMACLCSECHAKYHKGELNIDIYRF